MPTEDLVGPASSLGCVRCGNSPARRAGAPSCRAEVMVQLRVQSGDSPPPTPADVRASRAHRSTGACVAGLQRRRPRPAAAASSSRPVPLSIYLSSFMDMWKCPWLLRRWSPGTNYTPQQAQPDWPLDGALGLALLVDTHYPGECFLARWRRQLFETITLSWVIGRVFAWLPGVFPNGIVVSRAPLSTCGEASAGAIG
jgi:hypothetical protein